MKVKYIIEVLNRCGCVCKCKVMTEKGQDMIYIPQYDLDQYHTAESYVNSPQGLKDLIGNARKLLKIKV